MFNLLENLSNFTDEEIQKNITDFMQEIETLDPNRADDLRDINDSKRDILDLIQVYFHAKNLKMLDFLLKILLDSPVIKLSNAELNQMVQELEHDQIIMHFIGLYGQDQVSNKWSGQIKKKNIKNKYEKVIPEIRKSSRIRRKLSKR